MDSSLLTWVNDLRVEHAVGPARTRDEFDPESARAAAQTGEPLTELQKAVLAGDSTLILVEALSGEVIVAATSGTRWALHERGTLKAIADGELP